MSKMFSDKAQAVLTHLQANRGIDETFVDIAGATGIEQKSITGVLNGLAKKGYVERVVVDGVEGKVIRLTAEGATVDPDMDKPVE